MTNSVKTVGISRGNQAVLRDGGVTTEKIEVKIKIADFQRQDLGTERDLSEEMKRLS